MQLNDNVFFGFYEKVIRHMFLNHDLIVALIVALIVRVALRLTDQLQVQGKESVFNPLNHDKELFAWLDV